MRQRNHQGESQLLCLQESVPLIDQRLLLLACRTVAARLASLAHLFYFLHTLSVGFEVEGAVWLDACRASHPLCFVDSVIVHNFNGLR